MLKVALSHDIDRLKKSYQYITYLLREIKNLNYGQIINQLSTIFIQENTFWNLDDIINIENKYNIKSTFFFLNETIPFELFKLKSWQLSLGRYRIEDDKIVQFIIWLDQNGWEVGVHGSYNSFKDLTLLKEEKKILENIIGHEIHGIRQHYLNLNNDTWGIQYNAGFKYDASYGYTNNIGYLENKVKPFYPLSNSDFTVFPLAIMDGCIMNIKDSAQQIDSIIKQTIEHDGILVLNWHNNYFNAKEFPKYKAMYIYLIEKLFNTGATFDTLINYYKSINKTNSM
jgi:peptidoglycan/xylan/chitin deacetylase (PgdA/CDA1 family)